MPAIRKPTPAEFRAQFPEFDLQEYPDDVVERWIAAAGHIFAVSRLPWLFLTAHLLVIAKEDGALKGVAEADGGKGVIQVKRIGKKSITYGFGTQAGGSPMDHDNFYDRSSYGRVFRQMRNAAPSVGIKARIFSC